MFENQDGSKSDGANNFINPGQSNQDNSYASAKKKKVTLIIAISLGIIILAAVLWWVSSFLISKLKNNQEPIIDNNEETEQSGLDVYLNPNESVVDDEENKDYLSGVEYLSFSDFYKINNDAERDINFKNYNLPINVKLDVANYYEVSRKINLDAYLDDLNEYGFAVLDNPWAKTAGDFYSLAETLDARQISLFISADFISYYYQSTLKASFKEIEETVFYESLWNISKNLYENSRKRYEVHLTESGNINDRVLEAERLATAYFAVALELLKPHADQIDENHRFSSGLFNEQDQKRFSFQVPAYLNDDVLRELALIDSAKDKQKSPVLLYDRDYKNFIVPSEYKDNARLNNFYLAAAWLNSTFPLNYRNNSCPDCLLDKDDWRINFIAASLIAHDFSISQDLKNEWARVYKSLSFFKGLRDAWNYIDYRDGFETLFTKEGDIKSLFAENNLQAEDNLEALRLKLLERQALPIQGAFDPNSIDGRRFAGLQFLADFYWPNDFILSKLRYPVVGSYEGNSLAKYNITACSIQGSAQRCQGSSQDILKLIYPIWDSEYFQENSNYTNYSKAITEIRPLADEAIKSNINNYWASLYLWQNYLLNPEQKLPSYLQSNNWKNRMADSALASWVDMQLPMDKLSLRSQVSSVGNLSSGITTEDYALIEPNLEFFDRIIAHSQMIIGMFEALDINSRSNLAINYIKKAENELLALRTIAIKQSQGEDLNEADTQIIRDFAKMYSLEKTGEKSLVWNNNALNKKVRQNIGAPKILIIAHPVGDKIVFAAGPIFNHQESK